MHTQDFNNDLTVSSPRLSAAIMGGTDGQKWNSTFLTCPCHKISSEEAVGLKKFQLYFENYDFHEYVKFGAISWKFDILSTTVKLKFESKNPLHICDTYNCEYLPHTTFVST